MNDSLRWKQRFESFRKAFKFFKTIVEKDDLSMIEIAGMVQAFEFTFELGWKTIKDYLYVQGMDVKYPRDVIKEAFQVQLIEDGHMWLEMLEKRNELSHTYDEENASEAITIIKGKYFPAIEQVYNHFINIKNE